MKEDQPIVIIGGGIQGLSTATNLVKLGIDGKSIFLVEMKWQLGLGETQRSAGILMGNILRSDKDLALLNAESLTLWKELTNPDNQNYLFRETPPNLKRCGTVFITESDDKARYFREQAKFQNSFGITTRLLTSKSEIERLIPLLSVEKIKAALYCPEDMIINPADVIEAHRLFLLKQGVHFLFGSRVKDLVMEGNRVSGLIIDRAIDSNLSCQSYVEEKISTDLVVNAAGALGDKISAMAGVDLPTRNVPRTIWNILTKEDKETVSRMPFVEMVGGKYDGLYLKPGWNQGIDVSGHTEDYPELLDKLHSEGILPQPEITDLSLSIPPREIGRETTLDFLRDYFPTLVPHSKEEVSGYTGIRSYSIDGLPYLGPPEGVEGLLMQCYMSGWGITNSLRVGQLIATNIKEGRPSPEMEAYLPKSERWAGKSSPEKE